MCAFVCNFVHVHAYTLACKHMNACMHTCIRSRMHAHTHLCIHVTVVQKLLTKIFE